VMSARISLEMLHVPQPCPAHWDEMVGDDRRRFCAHCQKFVHDLSAMPRDEAERLVCESAGELCVRFARDPQTKQVITLDYQPRTVATRRRRMIAIVATILASFGAGGSWAAMRLLRTPPPAPPLNYLGGSVMPLRPTAPAAPAPNAK
jgi:hypothetical protein